MDEFKLIVAGSQGFKDYDLMTRVLIAMGDFELADKPIRIFSSTEKGAPAMAVRFAQQYSVRLQRFPASWKGIGAKAGYIRDSVMCTQADALLVFSDGKSNESEHLIALMKAQNKPTHIYKYNP